ncbi:hypothetical protein MKEN_01500000 [Mycena kentingensis (nom. inval.)]|nr:hypothetical protein MKEN_01500000 [Mycena kentingensis (nom. inval.)]
MDQATQTKPEIKIAPEPMSDTDRLIQSLQTCFKDLAKTQAEHTEMLKESIGTLRPPVPAADKETQFWTNYMKLADEYDNDFQKRYSTDLDTSLIFAGLFSAVSSAFIIQVQPEITDNPTVLTSVVLLYLSLFTTLSASLIAVLGKQWLIHYHTAGNHGTMKDRGVNRQAKYDGLRTWKFDWVLQLCPFLLQFALFLFTVAISLYLKSINITLAIIVWVVTSSGIVAYGALIIAAGRSENSPFQTPLTLAMGKLLRVVWTKMSTWPDKWRGGVTELGQQFKQVLGQGEQVLDYQGPDPGDFLGSLLELDPDLAKAQSNDESKSASELAVCRALSWTIQTATDVQVIQQAADLIPEQAWPQTLDVQPILNRLLETYWSCITFSRGEMDKDIVTVPTYLTLRAITCVQAYSHIRQSYILCQGKMGQKDIEYPPFLLERADNEHPEMSGLLDMHSILSDKFSFNKGLQSQNSLKWALATLPTLPSIVATPDTKSWYSSIQKARDFLSLPGIS